MKKIYIFFLLLLLIPLPLAQAGISVDTTYTHGPSEYHEIGANIYLTTHFLFPSPLILSPKGRGKGEGGNLTIQVGSIFSEDSINTQTNQLYNVGLDISVTEGIGLWANYNFAPEYSYDAYLSTITSGGYYFSTTLPINFNNDTISGGTKISFYGLNNKNKHSFFKTTLEAGSGTTRYKYDTTKQFRVVRRILNKDYEYTVTKTYEYEFKQHSYNFGFTETLGGVTTLSYSYSDYNYSEDPLLLPPNLKVVGIQGGVLPGFPRYSNQIGLSQELFRLFNISLGYIETKSQQYLLGEDAASEGNGSLTDILTSISVPLDILSTSYNLSLDIYLTKHMSCYSGYNLNKDSTGAKSKYISTGISYSF